MTQPLPRLQALLLDLVFRGRPLDLMPDLDERDWDVLMDLARQHRLAPLLHWRLSGDSAALPVPETIRTRLAAGFRASGLRGLLMRRELLFAHRILDAAGIPHLALKGAYLASHAYPHPALRPLRDLDLLVPAERALEAFQALIAAGCVRPSRFQGNPEACLAATKHLPPLRSASGLVTLELHSRLSETRWGDDGETLWRRAVPVESGGEVVRFPSPTDLLRHLIVHAAYDHQFDNGPLVLSDIAFLLRGHPIDWPLFWRLAESGGWSRGALLVLKMVESQTGLAPVPYPPALLAEGGPALADLVAAALLSTLGNVSKRGDVRLGIGISRQPSLGAKVALLLANAFPPRKQVAVTCPVAENSPLIVFWYLVRWTRLLTRRLPHYLASRRDHRVAAEIRQAARVAAWLYAKSE